MFAKLKLLALDFFNLSLLVRLTVGVVLGAIGSATVIGVLSEYAAVNYALAHGVRLPAEGVPYLRYAAAAMSFALFILALGTFLGIYAVLRLLLKVAALHVVDRGITDVGELPLRKYLVVFIPSAFIATQLPVGTLAVYASNWFPEYVAPTVALIITFLLVIFGRKPQWLTWFTLTTYVIGTIAIIVVLFTPTYYSMMLEFIRFGGGVPIEISRNCKDITPCVPTSQGKLFLRTKDYFLLINTRDKQITEIPSSTIIEYKYPGVNRWGKE